MKICAIICEYNPFHNGHLYQLRAAKQLSGADYIVCIMSGNFVQRGEPAILEKYVRAKHAVLAGADAVISLPTVFSTANAELFAKGAVGLLSSIPNVTTLCFGAEDADADAFYNAAKLLNEEPDSISNQIKTYLDQGLSYAKARAKAWSTRIPERLLSSPNNVLGLEYTKAIISQQKNIKILPIQRQGGGYNDNNLSPNFSSATAIRTALENGQDITGQTPAFVQADLVGCKPICLDVLEKYAILTRSTNDIAKVCDCTEGLENAFKQAAKQPAPLVESLTSARYTSSRIRRIALQNLLKIDETLIRDSLSSPLYLRVLAVNNRQKQLLSLLSESNFPLITRAHDEDVLTGTAKECYTIDVFADEVYNLISNTPMPQKSIFI